MGGPVRLRIDLAYDGAPFAGFARQRDRTTVQGVLEQALERLTGQPIATTCAGRTDRGVHALAQVVHADVAVAGSSAVTPSGVDAAGSSTPRPSARSDGTSRVARLLVDPEVLRERLDHLVGTAVTIWAVRRVPAGFDARFSATARHYRYRLVDDPAADDPIRRHDRWRVAEPLQVVPMRQAARHLLGEHDVASFVRRVPGRTTVRRVDEIAITRPGPGRIDVRVVGASFGHQQVRSMVGCLVEVGRGRRDPDWLAEVLAARDRSAAARVAPPQGLTLEAVSYGRRWPQAPPKEIRAALASRDRS